MPGGSSLSTRARYAWIRRSRAGFSSGLSSIRNASQHVIDRLDEVAPRARAPGQLGAAGLGQRVNPARGAALLRLPPAVDQPAGFQGPERRIERALAQP